MPRELTKSDLHTLHWLTLREVAGELGVSDEAVRQMIDAGRLASATVAGSGERRVHSDEVWWFVKAGRKVA